MNLIHKNLAKILFSVIISLLLVLDYYVLLYAYSGLILSTLNHSSNNMFSGLLGIVGALFLAFILIISGFVKIIFPLSLVTFSVLMISFLTSKKTLSRFTIIFLLILSLLFVFLFIYEKQAVMSLVTDLFKPYSSYPRSF